MPVFPISKLNYINLLHAYIWFNAISCSKQFILYPLHPSDVNTLKAFRSFFGSIILSMQRTETTVVSSSMFIMFTH